MLPEAFLARTYPCYMPNAVRTKRNKHSIRSNPASSTSFLWNLEKNTHCLRKPPSFPPFSLKKKKKKRSAISHVASRFCATGHLMVSQRYWKMDSLSCRSFSFSLSFSSFMVFQSQLACRERKRDVSSLLPSRGICFPPGLSVLIMRCSQGFQC